MAVHLRSKKMWLTRISWKYNDDIYCFDSPYLDAERTTITIPCLQTWFAGKITRVVRCVRILHMTAMYTGFSVTMFFWRGIPYTWKRRITCQDSTSNIRIRFFRSSHANHTIIYQTKVYPNKSMALKLIRFMTQTQRGFLAWAYIKSSKIKSCYYHFRSHFSIEQSIFEQCSKTCVVYMSWLMVCDHPEFISREGPYSVFINFMRIYTDIFGS